MKNYFAALVEAEALVEAAVLAAAVVVSAAVVAASVVVVLSAAELETGAVDCATLEAAVWPPQATRDRLSIIAATATIIFFMGISSNIHVS